MSDPTEWVPIDLHGLEVLIPTTRVQPQRRTPCPHQCCGHRRITDYEGHSHADAVEDCPNCQQDSRYD